MSRQVIATAAAPAAIGPYSQAIRTGQTVYISGQIGLVPATMQLADGFEAHYKLTQLCDENYTELEIKFRKGLRLFAKYFSCLWD